ncbi:MAG TPA: sugar transferase [Terriglobales bacterium]|nr:sugar transferase [Terriglobales bacterium]
MLPQALTNHRVSAANNPFTDVLLAYGSFAVALQLIFSFPTLGSSLVFAFLVVLLNSCDGVYSGRICEPEAMRRSLAKSVIWAALLVSVGFSLQAGPTVGAEALIISGSSSYLALCLWRHWRSHNTAQLKANSQGKRRVLIVGAGRLGQELALALPKDHDGNRVLVGLLDDEMTANGEIVGRTDELIQIARAQFVDEVIIAIPHKPELALRAMREARLCHLDVRTVPELFGEGPIEYVGRLPLITLHKEPVAALGPWAKRAFDAVLSLVALFLAAPLMALAAIAIKLDSPGPVFYRALRAGKKGKTFLCLKFRTMVAEADSLKETLRRRNERSGVFFKIAADPRITRLGRVLRRYSLDELPQLWNVVRGDMSLVGPRPHPLDDCRRYQLEYLRRLDVRPGITGLWQVTARRDPSFGRGLALDLDYIAHWNFWMDVRILLKTAGAVLQGNGE